MKNHYGAAVKQAMYYFRTYVGFRNSKFYSSNLAFEDFLQEALNGIIISIDKYDYNHPNNATFNTYAHNWIRSKCGRYLRDNASMIRMPIYRQGRENYAYGFLEIDNPEIDYFNFLQDVKQEF